RPAGLWERGAKWVRRRPAAALLIGFVAVSALGLAGLLAWHDADLRRKVREATEGEHRAGLQGEGREAVARGRAALAERRWADAELLLARALEKIDSEPGLGDPLADQRAEAAALRAQAADG